MNCKKCGIELPDGGWHCPECGEDNSKLCCCGAKNPQNTDTCLYCGRSFASEEQRSFFGNSIPRERITPLPKDPTISKNETHFSTALKRLLIATGLFLIAWLCFHLGFKSIGYETGKEFNNLLSSMQWMRFSTLAFSFSAFSIIIFDELGSKKAKIFTALCVVVFFLISWFFLFPTVSGEELLGFLYEK